MDNSNILSVESALARKRVRRQVIGMGIRLSYSDSSKTADVDLVRILLRCKKLMCEYGATPKLKGGGNGRSLRKSADQRHRPTCENPITWPEIEPGSQWWEASRLTAQPPRAPPERERERERERMVVCVGNTLIALAESRKTVTQYAHSSSCVSEDSHVGCANLVGGEQANRSATACSPREREREREMVVCVGNTLIALAESRKTFTQSVGCANLVGGEQANRSATACSPEREREGEELLGNTLIPLISETVRGRNLGSRANRQPPRPQRGREREDGNTLIALAESRRQYVGCANLWEASRLTAQPPRAPPEREREREMVVCVGNTLIALAESRKTVTHRACSPQRERERERRVVVCVGNTLIALAESRKTVYVGCANLWEASRLTAQPPRAPPEKERERERWQYAHSSSCVSEDSNVGCANLGEASRLTAQPPRAPQREREREREREMVVCVGNTLIALAESRKTVHVGCANLVGGEQANRSATACPPREKEREREDYLYSHVGCANLVGGEQANRSATACSPRERERKEREMIVCVGNKLISLAESRKTITLHWGRGGAVVRLLTTHLGEPGSIPGGVPPLVWRGRIVLDDIAGWRVLSGVSRLPSPLHSDDAPISPRFTLIGSQDLDVTSHANLSIPFHCSLFPVISSISEALLNFYLQDIPPPHALRMIPEQANLIGLVKSSHKDTRPASKENYCKRG
ncbi:hypothetical protein PR048_007457 [Dryococelus australis]|uniref:Uncharacterized protein n=1 Tax=Dryococelus australis TaxID=614101 RepID=A0ABQ9HUA3_9NEOP|nr:hypothetical protein PR048_007457 [Dryococelus australis]